MAGALSAASRRALSHDSNPRPARACCEVHRPLSDAQRKGQQVLCSELGDETPGLLRHPAARAIGRRRVVADKQARANRIARLAALELHARGGRAGGFGQRRLERRCARRRIGLGAAVELGEVLELRHAVDGIGCKRCISSRAS